MAGERAEGPLQIFCSYSHKDADLLDQFKAHTAILRRTGPVLTWTDREILPGSDWSREIASRLNSADIIVLLVSADFIASDYCYTKELGRAMERHAADETKVVPIIVRSCLWRKAPIGKLQELPRGGKAITDWSTRKQDQAWTEVAIELSQIVEAALLRAQHQMEIPAEFSIHIQTGIEVSNQKAMMERWRILQATQSKIFEIQADVMAKRQAIQETAAQKWDAVIRDP